MPQVNHRLALEHWDFIGEGERKMVCCFLPTKTQHSLFTILPMPKALGRIGKRWCSVLSTALPVCLGHDCGDASHFSRCNWLGKFHGLTVMQPWALICLFLHNSLTAHWWAWGRKQFQSNHRSQLSPAIPDLKKKKKLQIRKKPMKEKSQKRDIVTSSNLTCHRNDKSQEHDEAWHLLTWCRYECCLKFSVIPIWNEWGPFNQITPTALFCEPF